MKERWIADRAILQQLIQKHPEWTQQELADWIGRSLGWVKKWVKRLREAPPGDARVLFSKPFGRKTPYPQTDPEVEERILSIRDAPPENLERTPGPRAILYYLPRDPQLQHHIETLPRSTQTIWKILQRNDRIAHEKRRKRKPVERPLSLQEIQMDFKDISTVPAAETGKQQHVVEAFNFMDAGTSILLDAQVQADFHAQTALQAVIHFLQRYGLPPKITFDRDPRLVGAATGRDFPSPCDNGAIGGVVCPFPKNATVRRGLWCFLLALCVLCAPVQSTPVALECSILPPIPHFCASEIALHLIPW